MRRVFRSGGPPHVATRQARQGTVTVQDPAGSRAARIPARDRFAGLQESVPRTKALGRGAPAGSSTQGPTKWTIPAPKHPLAALQAVRAAHALPPNDPDAVLGTQPLVNVIETDENYTMGQNDFAVLATQPLTVTLAKSPLTVTPVLVVADGGAVTVQGGANPIQGGAVALAQGTAGFFSFSPISDEWSVLKGGGGGAPNLPLARLRWIDGNTAVPPLMQTGTESAPYQSPQAWLASLGPPTSTDDANTLELGILSPTAPDVWNPNPQTWVIPPSRNIQIQSFEQTEVTNDFSPLTITWANTPLEGVSLSSLSLVGLNLSGVDMTVTDVAGAPPSTINLIGTNASGTFIGSIDLTGAAGFQTLSLSSMFFDGDILSGVAPTWTLSLEGTTTWDSTDLSCGFIVVFPGGTSISDTVALTTTQTQDYGGASISTPAIQAGGTVTFYNGCSFIQATTLTAPRAVFDGPSWASFREAGGIVSPTTVVMVVGGFLAGQVPGAAIATPPGNSVSLALDGAGASAGFTQGGNWYKVTALAPSIVTTVTLLDNANPGDTICLTRTDATAKATLAVADQGAGVFVSLIGPGSIVAEYDGTAWIIQLFSSSGGTATASGWSTVLDLDFTIQVPQVLSPDGPYTIAGNVWNKINSGNDAVPMAIVAGQGLVVQPVAATDYSNNVRTLPALLLPLTSLTALAGIDWSTPLRLWAWVSAENIGANFDGACLGLDVGGTATPPTTAGNLVYYAQKIHDGVDTFLNRLMIYNSTANSQSAAPDFSNPTMMLEIPDGIAGLAARLFTGLAPGGGAWPAPGSLDPNFYNTFATATGLNPNATDLGQLLAGLAIAEASLVLGASRAGSGTPLSITFARVRVDFHP